MSSAETIPPDPDDSWEREYRRARLRSGLKIFVVAAGLLAVLAAIPWAFGYGVLGTSLFSEEDAEIHVMNNTNTKATLVAERAGGLWGASQTFEIQPRQQKSFGLLGGAHTLTLTRGDEVLIDARQAKLTNHLFITAAPETCYAVFDLEPLYTGQGAPSAFPVVARFGPNELMYSSDAENLVLPRKVHPGRKSGSIEWIEDFNCDTVAPENEEILQEVALNTLTLRQQELEEARERRRRAIENAR